MEKKLSATALEKIFKNCPLKSQEDSRNPMVMAKVYSRTNVDGEVWGMNYYLIGYDPSSQMALCYVERSIKHEFNNWGYIHMDVLISRGEDTILYSDFKPKTFSECLEESWNGYIIPN